MTNSERPQKQYADASERPGAIVIRPPLNPDMVYDPETKRVTDTVSGDSFGVRQRIRSGGIYAAGIMDKKGSGLYEFELKYGGKMASDGTIIRTVWEVFSARRRGYLERFKPLEIGSENALKLANAEAQKDSLERLAQFLRAMNEGPGRSAGREPEGETVIVDRRMDDTSNERVW